MPALPRRLPFVKMNGLGNDFLVVDLRKHPDWEPVLAQPLLVRRICDRHRGVGSDGILAVGPAQSAESVAAMRVHNADGSIAEMCGNGLRCVAHYLFEQDEKRFSQFDPPSLTVDTGAGALLCQFVLSLDGVVQQVEIEMGQPKLLSPAPASLSVGKSELSLTLVSMGNPHAVAFCDPAQTYSQLLAQATEQGPLVETHPLFPQRTNVEFVNVQGGAAHLDVVVWERGCGVTQACGTGACAAVVAACLRGLVPLKTPCTVRLPGGLLTVTVAADYTSVRMRGEAETVFCGEVITSSIMA